MDSLFHTSHIFQLPGSWDNCKMCREVLHLGTLLVYQLACCFQLGPSCCPPPCPPRPLLPLAPPLPPPPLVLLWSGWFAANSGLMTGWGLEATLGIASPGGCRAWTGASTAKFISGWTGAGLGSSATVPCSLCLESSTLSIMDSITRAGCTLLP